MKAYLPEDAAFRGRSRACRVQAGFSLSTKYICSHPQQSGYHFPSTTRQASVLPDLKAYNLPAQHNRGLVTVTTLSDYSTCALTHNSAPCRLHETSYDNSEL